VCRRSGGEAEEKRRRSGGEAEEKRCEASYETNCAKERGASEAAYIRTYIYTYYI
jgi:hypothetical protein